MRNIALLGSTGSIGVNTLDVVREHPDRFRVHSLTTNSRWRELAAQAAEFRPQVVVIADERLRNDVQPGMFPSGTKIEYGARGLCDIARDSGNCTVVSAVVGAAGLPATWEAVQCGKRVAVANKETLVVAGGLITALAAETGAQILPVDSEHSALFQCLAARDRSQVAKLWLTASGGPFREASREQIERVTVEQALAHPTWKMGPKISIDSATMVNKALELIEARWLFGTKSDQLGVVIHPQSVIHSMVEYVDGSVIAQLSPPDMRLPIQYALTFPERLASPARKMRWEEAQRLDFFPPDLSRFPAIRLGFRVADEGGTAGAVFNAANEVAVARFLEGSLTFVQIVQGCEEILDRHAHNPSPTLEELFEADRWARLEMQRWKL